MWLAHGEEGRSLVSASQDLLKTFLEPARLLALQASKVVMSFLHQPLDKKMKSDKSWVTEADLQSDKIIKEGLLKKFPTHGILTEESGVSGKEGSDWLWLIDPLDGTKAFAKGIPGFSVMLGLLHEGKPKLGVVVDPLLGLIYEAVYQEGAYLTEKGQRSRLQVSKRSDPKEMPLVVSTGFPEEKMEGILKKYPFLLCPPINSVGIKVGLVVRQEADVYMNHHPVHYWDTAAPQIILEEAGGILTRIDGKSLDYNLQRGTSHGALTLVSNGTRHAELASFLSHYPSSFK